MNHYQTEGFVLHQRPWRETSVMLDVLTLELGRVRLMLKGARSSKPRHHRPLPFVPAVFVWGDQGQIPYLRSVDMLAASAVPEGKSLLCGIYINELMLRFLPERDPVPDIYSLYRDLVGVLLAPFHEDTEWDLRRFECSLLQALGYGFDLCTEGETGKAIVADGQYGFHPEYGMVAMQTPLPGAIHGSTLLALASDTVCPGITARREAKRLMRRVIDHCLDGRPLKSRELFI